MGNRERPIGKRVARALILTVGVLGGLMAVDAVLLFLVLLLAPVFIAPANAYIGLVLFVVVPILAGLGGVLAWSAYALLKERTPDVAHHGHQVRV